MKQLDPDQIRFALFLAAVILVSIWIRGAVWE
jgi:hypothetical protein